MIMSEEITPKTVMTRMLVIRRLYMREHCDVPKEIHLGIMQDAAARTLKEYDADENVFYGMKVILLATENFIEVR